MKSAAALIILAVLLSLLWPFGLGLMGSAVASASTTTAGYAVSNPLPKIIAMKVLHVGLPYAAFISPGVFAASNYYVQATPMTQAGAGIAFGGDTLIYNTHGMLYNLSQAFDVSSSSVNRSEIYYAVAFANTTDTVALQKVSSPGIAYAVTPLYKTQGATSSSSNPITEWESSPYSVPSTVITSELRTQSTQSIFFVSPVTLAVTDSTYYFMAIQNPSVFIESYINISEPTTLPTNVDDWIGAYSFTGLYTAYATSLGTSQLVYNANYFTSSYPSPPYAAYGTYPYTYLPNVVLGKSSSGNYYPYSGLSYYPVVTFTPFTTQYFVVMAMNVSVNPGLSTVTLPMLMNNAVVSGTLTSGPMRPTLIIAPLATASNGIVFPWYKVVYFSPSNINNTAELYPLAVVNTGYNTYMVLAGGIGVPYLYVINVQVVPNALNATYDVPEVTASVSKVINFAGYGSPTSAVVNGYFCLVGTSSGNVVLVNLLKGSIINYVSVASQPLFSYTNLQTQPQPVPVVPFFTANITEQTVIHVLEVQEEVYTQGIEVQQGGSGPSLQQQITELWDAVQSIYTTSEREIILTDWNLDTATLNLGNVPFAYELPAVNDVNGYNDPEYIYVNGTLYEVVATAGVNVSGPFAGVSATGVMRSTLTAGTPLSVPLPTGFLADGVTLQVNKLYVLPGQTAHLVLYPWLQQGEISYAINYGLVNSTVLYTKYSTVSGIQTTGITYPSFYTAKLASELYDVGLSNVASHFIVTLADVKMHPPPYFTTASAWIATTIDIPTDAPVPLYSNLEATAGFQAYTDVVPAVNNNPQGIFATAFKQGAGPSFAIAAVGEVANGILSAYLISQTDATASSAALIATASVLSDAVTISSYVGVAIVVWAGVDYALAKWGGFGNAYVQDWVVLAPVFYDTQNGKYYTAVELVLPASEASNVPHYEQVLGSFFNSTGFAGYYFDVVYPFYTWQQLNESIASGAYQPQVNLTQLASQLSAEYGIPTGDMVLTGVRMFIITRIHAKETFWQYVTGPVDFLTATVIGTTYLDVEGTTNAVTYTNPAQIADVLQYATVNNLTVPVTVENGHAVASASVPPSSRLVVQLGNGLTAYADTSLQLHGMLVVPLHNESNGIWYGNITYGKFMPLQLGDTVTVDNMPVQVYAGNVSLGNVSMPLQNLSYTTYDNYYYYSASLPVSLGYIVAGETLAVELYANSSYLRPYAVPASVLGSDLPLFYGFRVYNPLKGSVTARLYVAVQSAPFNVTPHDIQLQTVNVTLPPGVSYVYVPMSAVAAYASAHGSYVNVTLELPAPRYNATVTEVWAPGVNLNNILESPKTLSGITVKVYNALNGSTIATGTVKAGSDALTSVNGTAYANGTGTALVQGPIFAGAYLSNWHVYNMTFAVIYNSTTLYIPAVPDTLKATVPWGPYALANSSAKYYWLTVWVTYSDGSPANATVYVYSGNKLKMQVSTYGAAFLALPAGLYNVSAKLYYPLNASKGSVTLKNVTVNLSSNTLVTLSSQSWEMPYYSNTLAIVGVTGPSSEVAADFFALPLQLYIYDLGVTSSNVTASAQFGSFTSSLTLFNGTDRLLLSVPLHAANGTYTVELKLSGYDNTTPVNTSYTVAYYKVTLRELLELYGLIYWHVVHEAHPPYLLPGDTVAVDVAFYGPALAVPVNVSLGVASPDITHYPQLYVNKISSYVRQFTINANSTYWVNSTLTVPFTPYIVITANYSSNSAYVVPWFSNVTVPVDPVANVSLVTVFGTLVSGKAVPVKLKVMSNVLPGSSRYAFINIYDNTTGKYVLTLLTQLQPVMYITKYVTLQNNKILFVIPEPAEYHTLTLVLTGVSIPYMSAVRVLVVSDSFLVFFMILLAIIIIVAVASGAVSGASHAIRNSMFRYVRRVSGSGRRYVRAVRGSGTRYVRRTWEDSEEERRKYVRKS